MNGRDASIMSSSLFSSISMILILMMAVFGVSTAQMDSPSPAPLPHSNDGAAVDQGIAYILLLVALAVTYLIH